MTRGAIKLLVLDMAGTTVQDDDLVLRCFREAIRIAELNASSEEINARMGKSKIDVFEEFAGRQVGDAAKAAEVAQRGYAIFREILEGAYAEGGAKAMRGAQEAFAWLRARDIRVALNTGFYREVTDLIVEQLGWRDKVDAIFCSDDVTSGRPAPFMIHRAMEACGVQSVAQVIAVGDTPSDIQAGRNAGVRGVVGVASGAHPATRLRREGPTHILDGVWQLPALVERLERLRPSRSHSGHQQSG